MKLNLGGIETAVEEVIGETTDRRQPIYTLQGICVGTDWTSLPSGIYIVNGQKRMKR